MNNYYTPNIDDIYVGYECEILWNYNYLPVDEWCKVKILLEDTKDFDLYDFTSRIKKEEIRTKYLNLEDIEKMGWILNSKKSNHYNNYFTKISHIEDKLEDNVEFELDFFTPCETPWIIIRSNLHNHIDHSRLYTGRCKSINELNKLMKFLNIV